MELKAAYALEDNFLAEGVLVLPRQLRSILRNFSRSKSINFHMSDGKKLKASLYWNLGYVHSKELAAWCEKNQLKAGTVIYFAPIDDESHDEFAITIEGGLKKRKKAKRKKTKMVTPPDILIDRQKQLELVTKGLKKSKSSSPFSFLVGQRARQCLARKGMERLTCLDKLDGVSLYRHQLVTVKRVLQEMHGRALLADEVGLGKTIEAGLCLKEYLARGLVDRFIIFTPASLVLQWQEELQTKFGIETVIHSDIKGWDCHQGIVASLDTAKAEKNREAIRQSSFQMVIVDEAHKLKNQRTLNWKFIHSLQTRFLLLLTATPVQNSIEEIYNQVFLVKPGLLGTRRAFRSMFVSRRNEKIPRKPEQLHKVLAAAMVRHRRDDTNLTFTARRVSLEAIPFDKREEELYSTLYDFVRAHYAGLGYFEEGLNRLTLMLLERMVTSSPQALLGSLQKILTNRNIPRHYRHYLEKIEGLAVKAKTCSKARRVCKLVKNTDEKVVVYTQFRDSQEHLCRQLKKLGVEPLKFHGGLTPKAREKVVKAFAKEKQVLVSTDSGGEGKNLQFCRNLINYDLPWNPMKVEQRIGRIHRLGQKRDVNIMNLYYLDSIEEYVVKLLSDKIRLFTLIVGEVDTILGLTKLQGDLEKTIMDIYLTADDKSERERAFDNLGEKLSVALERYEEIKQVQNKYFRF